MLDRLLDKYADSGVSEVENITVLKVAPFNEIGSMSEIVKKGFGGKLEYFAAVKELEDAIYKSA